jgi:hypothetical protein
MTNAGQYNLRAVEAREESAPNHAELSEAQIRVILTSLGGLTVSQRAIDYAASQGGVSALRVLLVKALRRERLLEEAHGLGVGHYARRFLESDESFQNEVLANFIAMVKELKQRGALYGIIADVESALREHDMKKAILIIMAHEVRHML